MSVDDTHLLNLDLLTAGRNAIVQMRAFVEMIDGALLEPHAKRLKREFRDELVAARARLADSANALDKELDRAKTGFDPPSVELELGKSRRAIQRLKGSALGIAIVAAAAGGAIQGLATTTIESFSHKTTEVEIAIGDAERLCEQIQQSQRGSGPGTKGTDDRDTESDDDALIDKMADSTDVPVRLMAAQQARDPAILRRLAQDQSVDVREAAFERLEDRDVLLDLAVLEDSDIRKMALERLPADLIAEVAANDSWRIRRDALEHLQGHRTLSNFAKDPSWQVRQYIAKTSTDEQALLGLARDSSKQVRKSALANKYFTQEMLGRILGTDTRGQNQDAWDDLEDPQQFRVLSEHPKSEVRLVVAQRVSNLALLVSLAKDTDDAVAQAAVQRIDNDNELAALARLRSFRHRDMAISQISDTGALEKLARSKNPDVRQLALGRITSGRVLKILKAHPNTQIRGDAQARLDELVAASEANWQDPMGRWRSSTGRFITSDAPQRKEAKGRDINEPLTDVQTLRSVFAGQAWSGSQLHGLLLRMADSDLASQVTAAQAALDDSRLISRLYSSSDAERSAALRQVKDLFRQGPRLQD